MQGEFTGLAHPSWAAPAGYSSPGNRKAFVEFSIGRRENPRGLTTFEEQVEQGRIICGTPKSVLPKIRRLLEETRPGIFAIWGNDGTVSHKDAMSCIRLLGEEVCPAIREMGKELGLDSPFDVNSPVSIDYSTDLKQTAAE